ncbi:tyrosine-type recombinase/integrase [Mycolicibacterium phocaicum]|uniref:tyrosine-type recombinase/integrase n=1 Tax=Mycolicibacterium phocaicum TaxID=319706 RepID=UPI001CFB7394|nr:tyrosine-type recombinase/integrase [Mycolicibacterium phocaicum]UCZ61465.1 tyrosine-type recombinase/integrase [Mycolicibacterium phocaicum]
MAYVRTHDTKATARGKVVKRYEVVYRAKVRTDDGRTVTRLRQETHPTKAAAEARAAELNARKHRRAVDPAEARKRGNRTFGEWAGDWLDSQRLRQAGGYVKQNTVDGYADLLDRYVLPDFADEPIGSIDVMAIDRYMARLSVRKTRQGKVMHPKTVKHAWHVLSRVFEYAARKDALEVNPVLKSDYHDNHKRGKKSATATKRFDHHPLSIDQLGDVSTALRGQSPASAHGQGEADSEPLPEYPIYALMVEFLASTGLRSAENAGLEVRDIRFTPALAGQGVKGSVRVERVKNRISGGIDPETGKRRPGIWIEEPPKSERSTRTVPLPGWLATKMADYLANDHPRADEPTAPLWPSRKNGGGYRAKGARYSVPLDWSAPLYMETFADTIFKPALRAAGLPVSETVTIDGVRTEVEGVRIHDLRHTAAHTWLSAPNADIRVVSEWLGHADYTVTLTVYSDLIKGESAARENTAPEPKSVPKVVPIAGRTG